ncbi:TonB-dependent receptor plug domain-containing protein [Thermodesulfobacterium hveragerdense]|uniref:TonB-dependent receptor plug domain-containing protein n=1 Tax=Thermodesulfobacterium hveragerdense TaxID=53424 RepID=UPI000425C759|nr:TonB-dependent receptor [Thermodesulfobacterium hveragerdense]
MGKKFFHKLSLSLILGLIASPGLCVENSQEVPEVVISADRIEEPVKESTTKVTVITKEDLEKKNFTFVSEVLRSLPQIYITAYGGPGQTAGAILGRGTKSAHTLVLIDGFKVNDPSSGMFDFGSLSVDDIERIEIIEGPQSTLYGSEAVGGVINIITKKGKGKPKVGLLVEGGSYGTYKTSLELSGEAKFIDFRLNVLRYYTEGFSATNKEDEKDGFKNTFFSSKIGLYLHPKARLELLGNYNYGRVEYDGFADKEALKKYHNYLIGTKLALSLLDNYKQIFSLYKNNYQRKDYTPKDWFIYTRYLPSTEGFSWENLLNLNKAYSLVFGLDFKREKVEMYSEGSFSNDFYDKKREHVGVFLNNKVSLLNDTLILNAGLRHDDYKSFGEKTTYRIGFRYLILKVNLVLRGNYGTAFRVPTFDDLFYPGYNNSNLKPEESKGWDLYLEKDLLQERLVLGAGMFYQKYKDLIQFNLETWKPQNVGKAVIKGAEANLSFKLTQNLRLKANYTYLDSEDRDKHKYLTYKPFHKVRATLEYSLKKLAFLADYTYTGKRFANVDNSKRLKPYSLVNLSANYYVSPNLKIYFKIDNLLNANYEETKEYNNPDRSFYIGIRLSY